MTEPVIRVHAYETGESDLSVRIEAGQHVFIGDETAANGGDDLGPSPFQLLAAALAECTAMTVRIFARSQGWPLEHVAVQVTHEKAAVEGRHGLVDVFHKVVEIRGADLSDVQHMRLLEVASRCPVHRALESDPAITTVGGSILPRPVEGAS